MNLIELYWAWVATIEPFSVFLSFCIGTAWGSMVWANRPRRSARPSTWREYVYPEPHAYTWNKPERLPPVGCPLVLNLGQAYDWDIAFGERISHLRSRSDVMDYQLSTGQIVRGRFEWSYP